MTANDPVLLTVDGGVATVTLAQPDRRNALSPAMVAGIVTAYEQAEADPRVRCVVLAAQGPVFCAGADLAVVEAAAAGDFDVVENAYRGFLRVAESVLPTIAVVDGPAIGAGMNLALAADLRIASAAASFDPRFPTLELLPGGGHVWMLERLVGPQAATAIALFGQRLDAVQARELGLVWQVHPDPRTALAAAVALAARLRGHEREYVVALAGQVRAAGRGAGRQEAVDAERWPQRWSATRPVFRDGVGALRASVGRRRSTADEGDESPR